MSNIQQLQSKLADLSDRAKAIEAKANREGRDLTAAEYAEIKAMSADFDATEGRIEVARMDERASAPQGPKSAPAPVGGYYNATALPSRGSTSTTGIRSGPTAGTAGFNSPGEWLASIRAASAGQVDGRLMNTVTTFGGESGPGGTDGGFSVPPDWRREILELVAGPGTLLEAMSPIYTPSNQVTIPTDEAAPHSTSGITAAWTAEAESITVSKPALRQVNVVLHKAAGLVHLSDELVEDSPATAGYALRVLARKVGALVEKSIVAGTGLAQPLGILNAPGLVVQAKSATGATVITATDVCNMVSRMIPGSFANSFWIMHSSVLAKIWTLTLGQQPIIAPDFSKSPFGTLLGRPIIVSEFASDYNTQGDIALVSPDGYALALKSGGLRSDTSMHVGFDQHLQSFRCTMRVGGAPLLSAPVARASGSNTMSHLVVLAVRS